MGRKSQAHRRRALSTPCCVSVWVGGGAPFNVLSASLREISTLAVCRGRLTSCRRHTHAHTLQRTEACVRARPFARPDQTAFELWLSGWAPARQHASTHARTHERRLQCGRRIGHYAIARTRGTRRAFCFWSPRTRSALDDTYALMGRPRPTHTHILRRLDARI